jgi:hypothetical protein
MVGAEGPLLDGQRALERRFCACEIAELAVHRANAQQRLRDELSRSSLETFIVRLATFKSARATSG